MNPPFATLIQLNWRRRLMENIVGDGKCLERDSAQKYAS